MNDDGKITDMARMMVTAVMIPWNVSVMAFCLHNVLSAVLASVHPW